jgi:8-oxo-dGTP diphosphatase
VLWRRADDRRGAIEVAVVHRPRYDDWSWPKGGVEPGEHLLQTAARELREETGHAVTLGASLGSTTYRHDRGETTVHWWSARARELPLRPLDPDEVDELRWVSPAEALRLLTYRSDRAPLRRLTTRPLPDATVLLVRHASAGKRSEWNHADELRPLDPLGVAQAARLADVLTVFTPVSVASADLVRCVDTVTPLAERIGRDIERDTRLAFATWVKHPTRIVDAILAAARKSVPGEAAVLCSQGEAIPSGVTTLVKRARPEHRRSLLPSQVRSADGTPRARKGSVWVLGLIKGKLVAADYFADVEPLD